MKREAGAANPQTHWRRSVAESRESKNETER
jgi:hypothetical protein